MSFARPILVTSLILIACMHHPASGQEADPPVRNEITWYDDDYRDELLDGTGSGGGPSMVWYRQDVDELNAVLGDWDPELVGLPEKSLYWGGAGWGSIGTGRRLFVALGGGGLGGSQEKRREESASRWSHAAGYLAVKGVYPLHLRLFLEGGLQLGGGSTSFRVERRAESGVVEIHLRGDRDFLMIRPQLGLDLRLARWIGFLFEGGYQLTSGDWQLEGNEALIRAVEEAMPDGDAFYLSFMIRFGI
jgi:hypothetical protein